MTPGGTSSQPSPPLPQSAVPVAASSAAVPDVKMAGVLTDMKDDVKTAAGLTSLSAGNLSTTTAVGFGFSVSLDKDETKVCVSSLNTC